MERGWEDTRTEQEGLRIVREEIPARSGPVLGVLYAGIDLQTPPHARETAGSPKRCAAGYAGH